MAALASTGAARRAAHSDSVTLSPHDMVVRLDGALGKNLLGVIVGKSSRTVTRWKSEESVNIADDDLRTITNTYQIFALLSPVEGSHTIRAWFMGMNPQLEDQSPAEALAEGMFRETMAAARAFVNGG